MIRGSWVWRNGELVEKGGPKDIRPVPPRSDLPCPMLISDEMAPTEHVDGNFYTSKAGFRSVTKANGLTEVGNERLKPRKRQTVSDKDVSDAIDKAVAQYSQGKRPKAA